MSLNSVVPFSEINTKLNDLQKVSGVSKITTKIQDAAFTVRSANATQLGSQVTQAISGIESLTSEIDFLPEGGLSPPTGVCRINSIPGLESIFSPPLGAGSLLKLITGSTSLTGGLLTEIIASTSPVGISGIIQSVTGLPVPPQVLGAIAGSDFASSVVSSLQDLKTLDNKISSDLGFFENSLNSVLKAKNGGVINKVALTSNDVLQNEVVNITKGKLDEAQSQQAVELLLDRKTNEASSFVSESLQKNKAYDPEGTVVLNQKEVEELISTIDPSLSNIVNNNIASSVDFGEATTEVFEMSADEQDWYKIKTPVRRASNVSNPNLVESESPTELPVGFSFSFVNSYEELISELKATNREITEAVIHWTEHYVDQGGVGSEEIHEIHTQSGFDGIGYHYVIKRNGDLQRGRPVNQTGEHAPENGHNSYSIGIALVAGYNCPSGTTNRGDFISADSITGEQFLTLSKLLKAFYVVFPGGQVWGHNDISPSTQIDPGFDVPEYVLRKFGKRNASQYGTSPALSPQELVQLQLSNAANTIA